MSPRDANDGRLPHGVGCGHEWPLRPRSVERPTSLVAHKLPGDDGGVFGVTTLPPGPERSPCIGPHGQYCGGLLHQPPRGPPISPFVQVSTSGPLVVSGQTPLFEGHLYPGTVECQSRCPVEAGAEAWGMASPPRGGGVHMAEVLQSPGGSVCDPGNLALSPLVLSLSPSPVRSGCHGAVVAEAMPVRLSSDCTAPWSSGESSPGWSSSPPCSTSMAGQTMVCGSGVPTRGPSEGNSSQEGYPLTGGWNPGAPPPRAVEAVAVAPEGAQFIAAGLSTEVGETLLRSRASSIYSPRTGATEPTVSSASTGHLPPQDESMERIGAAARLLRP